MANSVISIHTNNSIESYYGPKGWNDMTREQLLLWCGILQQELTRNEALYMACVSMYGIPRYRFIELPEVFDINLTWHMDWLLENKLTSNIIGSFRLFLTKYYGPANRLANITIGEFRQTELFYDFYLRTGQKKYLYLLCAVLFRPKGKNRSDDERCAIHEIDVLKRADKFKRFLHPNFSKAIQLQYEGCRNYIKESFPLIYPKNSLEDNVSFNPLASMKSNTIQDLQDHILSFSGDKLGTYEETEHTNLYLFMKHMSLKLEEYNERKRK